MNGRKFQTDKLDLIPAGVFHADIAETGPVNYKGSRKFPRIRFSDKNSLDIQRRKTPRKRGYLFFFYVSPRTEPVKYSKYADYKQTGVNTASRYVIRYRNIQRLYPLTISKLLRILRCAQLFCRRRRKPCLFRLRQTLWQWRLFLSLPRPRMRGNRTTLL